MNDLSPPLGEEMTNEGATVSKLTGTAKDLTEECA